jgi:hypothetical protein
VREVEPVSGAHLDHAPRETGEQAVAVLARPVLPRLCGDSIEDPGEQGVVDLATHGCLG